MPQAITSEEGRPSYTLKQVEAALWGDKLSTLQWGSDPFLGQCLLIRFANRGFDMVIARAGAGYEVFAAGSLPRSSIMRDPNSVAKAAEYIEMYFDVPGHAGKELRDRPLSQQDLGVLLADMHYLASQGASTTAARRAPTAGYNWVDAISTRPAPASASQPGRAP